LRFAEVRDSNGPIPVTTGTITIQENLRAREKHPAGFDRHVDPDI
jgi:hypothetical protein